jgi:hypothetical protein
LAVAWNACVEVTCESDFDEPFDLWDSEGGPLPIPVIGRECNRTCVKDGPRAYMITGRPPGDPLVSLDISPYLDA